MKKNQSLFYNLKKKFYISENMKLVDYEKQMNLKTYQRFLEIK